MSKNTGATKPADDKTAGTAPPAINVEAIKAKVISEAHPVANIFPMMSGDEFTNLCVSVRVNGFDILNPIKRDPTTKKITDGRNRQAAVEVINAEIALWNADAANKDNQKTPVQAAYIDEETSNDAELLSLVMLNNFTRRNMSSSQKAAVLVKAGVLSGAFARKAELGEAGKKVAGDITMLIAAQHGINHDYVYKARHIAKNKKLGKALIEAISLGEKTIMQAYAEVKALEDGTGNEGNDGTNPVDPAAVLDGLKKPVGDEWKPVFQSREKFATVAKFLRDARKLMDEIAAAEGGELLADGNNLKEAKAGISATAKALRNCEPHVVCPHCDGSGKHPDKGDKFLCPVCAGIGYLTEPQYEAFQKHGVLEEEGEKGEEGKGEEAKTDKPKAAKKPKGGKSETGEPAPAAPAAPVGEATVPAATEGEPAAV